ncbi:MAG: hypothetical protein IJF27_03215 [Oscillospiraceae bacterium]|nr:hypothetical protein [Oscillospiraceae bacterium]
MQLIKKILAHLVIIIGIMLIVFLIIDKVNSAMGFIDNIGTKVLMGVECGSAMLLGIITAAERKKR